MTSPKITTKSEIKQIIEGVFNLTPDNSIYVHGIKQIIDQPLHEYEDLDYDVSLRDANQDLVSLFIHIHELELINKRLSQIGLRLLSITHNDESIVLCITGYQDCGCYVCKENEK
jgi:hypothetical protein